MKLGPVKQHLQGSRSYLLWSLKLSWSEVADLHVKCGTLHNAVWSSPFADWWCLSLAGQTDPTGGVKGGQESLEASNKGVSRKCFESQTLCFGCVWLCYMEMMGFQKEFPCQWIIFRWSMLNFRGVTLESEVCVLLNHFWAKVSYFRVWAQ